MPEIVDLLVEYFGVDGAFIVVLMKLMPQTDALTNEISKVGIPHAVFAVMILVLVYATHLFFQKLFNPYQNLG